jgi:ribose 5-phosphate isomerase A
MGISAALAESVAARAVSGQVIGAGSGSSALAVVEALGRRVAAGDLTDVVLIPTSLEITAASRAAGFRVIPIGTEAPAWCFDGADEIDPANNLIKGRGGAMLAEKLVFLATDTRIVIGSADKRVETLGTKFAVGVELMPKSLEATLAVVDDLGGQAELRKAGTGKDGPVLTEHGGLIVDVRLPEVTEAAFAAIERVPGVLTSGAFFGFDVEVLLDEA